MWEIVELNSEQFELFKIELNRVSPLVNRIDWAEQFVFEHRTMIGTVGFTPGLFELISEFMDFLKELHSVSLKDAPKLDHWDFVHGDYLYFTFLKTNKEF